MGIEIHAEGVTLGTEPLPDGDAFVAVVERVLNSREVVHDAVEASPDGRYIAVNVHPAADEVGISRAADDRILVQARTSTVGPGYHQYVCDELLRPIAEALDIDPRDGWQLPEGADGQELLDDGMYLDGDSGPKDRERLERAFLDWLGSLAEMISGRSTADKYVRTQISMPIDTQVHPPRGSVATVLGPRPHSWFDRARRDPLEAIDILPWWTEGLGRNYLLGRALSRMWFDVPWRAPIDREEREMMEGVLADLAAVRRLKPAPGDSSAPRTNIFPVAEWAELTALLGNDPADVDRKLAKRAAALKRPGVKRLAIGYRRNTITHVHPSGWRFDLPGRWQIGIDHENPWVATDGHRFLKIAVFAVKPDPASREAATTAQTRSKTPQLARLRSQPAVPSRLAPPPQRWAFGAWTSSPVTARRVHRPSRSACCAPPRRV